MTARDARHVKGLQLRGVVRALRGWARETGQPLSVPRQIERYFGAERVMATGWYPFADFLLVLDLWHRVCHGGTEQGAVRMGDLGARETIALAGRAQVDRGVEAALGGFSRHWQQAFDFADLHVERSGRQARVRFVDYDDIGLLHGLLHVGWFRAKVELAGAQGATARAATRPWESGQALEIALAWQSEGRPTLPPAPLR